MGKLIDTDQLSTYDQTGVAPFINDFSVKKLTSTVSGSTVSFTDTTIGSANAIDGPYIQDLLIGVNSVSRSGNTVTYTLSDSSANGKSAIIWVRHGTGISGGAYFGTSVGFSNIDNIWVEEA